jgi:hypothetical protein
MSPMKKIEAVVVVLIVALGISLTLNYSLYASNQQLSSAFNSLNQEYKILAESTSAQITSTTNPSLGLNFTLTMNTTVLQSGRVISINLSETNTLPHFNNITASDNWAYFGFPEQTCVSGPAILNLPFALAIVQGDYSKLDLNGTTSLPILSPPGLSLLIPCSLFWAPAEYDFYPSSNVAIAHNGTVFNVQNESISTSMNFSGYYSSGYYNSSGTYIYETINFSPGMYTVIGGDEWGQMVILHFIVT